MSGSCGPDQRISGEYLKRAAQLHSDRYAIVLSKTYFSERGVQFRDNIFGHRIARIAKA
ncbi:hypothetical protein ROBYS_44920 [Roseobacter sp. OBYS 0001]|nr:hypothetical protein ROBYS_44920 [Roseobacter sp. OBYS 0001]